MCASSSRCRRGGDGIRPELPREHGAAGDEEHEPGEKLEIRISLQADAAVGRAKGEVGEQSACQEKDGGKPATSSMTVATPACVSMRRTIPMVVIETPTIVAEVGRM